MGLDANGTKFLLYAAREGVRFERTAMIGRQGLHLSPRALRGNLTRFGHACSPSEAAAMLADGGYAEPFLRILGATDVRSFDASDYEGATDILDLNQPVDATLTERFTVVLDGGTLEHVFNLPAAILNCMRMVALGGHFVSITPANNFLGHGFFQFSPELFFRVLSPQCGFSECRVLLFEDVSNARWYEVADPDRAGERLALVNTNPTYLAVMARKTAPTPNAISVQQSDYVAAWRSQRTKGLPKTGVRDEGRLAAAVVSLQRAIAGMVAKATNKRLRRQSTRNERFFKEISLS